MNEKTKRNKIAVCLLMMFFITVLTSCAKQGVNSAYQVDITMEGGSGKAYIKSPVEVTDSGGKMTARLVWSSKNYDYMIVGGVRYDNENPGGESTFTVDIDSIEGSLNMIGDTVAMSTPHEIEYVITWGNIVSGEAAKNEAEGAGDQYDVLNDQDPEGGINDAGSDREPENHSVCNREAVEKALAKAGLELTDRIDLEYARCFSIEKYGDYVYIPIENSGDYLVVPDGGKVPEGLPEDVTILQKPLDKTYLVSTSVMDLVNACGALENVRLSGTSINDWYIDDARKAMEKGDMIYAGKYRAPDYEVILENGCNLAIENTMIYHQSAVKEKLEELGIPVLVETSSYEEHPLGRLEWIRLYGVLYDREEEAGKFFEDSVRTIEPLLKEPADTQKTVAFFHVTASGLVNVRVPGDYISRMIELSGGHYVPSDTGKEKDARSTMNIQMEDFYEQACRADILIYNSTIGGELSTVDELIDKNSLFTDFDAVKSGRVYCTERNLFQQITGMADFIKELNDIMNGVDRDYTYVRKLE